MNKFKEYLLNESSEEKTLLLDAIDILSLVNTRITDSKITSNIEKIINYLSSTQRKIK